MSKEPDLTDAAKEVIAAVQAASKDALRALDLATEDLRYAIDKEVGRQLAAHPELYAELQRGARKLRRAADDVAEALGLR